jgi:hypothetical protein
MEQSDWTAEVEDQHVISLADKKWLTFATWSSFHVTTPLPFHIVATS